MNRIRVIPILTISNDKLVKTVRFKNPKYLGDPINAIKIFNDKEVDELIVLDITASQNKTKPNFDLIQDMAEESFMPLGYGGGIIDLETAKKIFSLGVEKVVLNTATFVNNNLISSIANIYGSQSVVVSLDISKNVFGNEYLYYTSGKNKSKEKIIEFAKKMEEMGAGEIIVNNIDNEGTFKGYNVTLIHKIAEITSIPIIACGGLNGFETMRVAIKSGATAISGGSFFAFKNNDRDSILINYPSQKDLMELLYNKF